MCIVDGEILVTHKLIVVHQVGGELVVQEGLVPFMYLQQWIGEGPPYFTGLNGVF